MFKLVTEDGVWLSGVRLSVPNWKPGDRIPRGRDTLEVVDVRTPASRGTAWSR